jgi:hypothetical protein
MLARVNSEWNRFPPSASRCTFERRNSNHPTERHVVHFDRDAAVDARIEGKHDRLVEPIDRCDVDLAPAADHRVVLAVRNLDDERAGLAR